MSYSDYQHINVGTKVVYKGIEGVVYKVNKKQIGFLSLPPTYNIEVNNIRASQFDKIDGATE